MKLVSQTNVRALFDSFSHNAVEVCKYLIESGADVDATDKTGATSLHICSYNGKLKMVKLLVQGGANLNIRDKEGCFALHKGMTTPK